MTSARLWLSLRLIGVVIATAWLAGCSKEVSYRYKLTLAVNTPNGVKRGASVGEVTYWQVSIPAKGIAFKLNGEALYLDLGPGARPLIALLGSYLHQKDDKAAHWVRDAGPGVGLMRRIYDLTPSENYLDDVPRIAQMRGAHKINPADLPDLVTFTDANDPKSVIEVDPNALQETLGPNVSWNEITLESTDEPVTKGIELKLPWIEAYFRKNFRLNGTPYHTSNELANILGWDDFNRSKDLRRSN